MPAGGRSAVGAKPTSTFQLNSMVGWWDALTYSGSGNLLNKGTAGAAGDMIPAGGPVFSTDHFTMDGVNDVFATAGNVTAFDAPAKGAGAFSFGVILKFLTTISFTTFMAKYPGTVGGYYMLANGTANQSYTQIRDALGGITAVALSPLGSASEKCVLATVVPNSGSPTSYKNSTAGTPVADNRTAAISSATSAKTTIGSIDGASYQNFQMFGAFIHQGALSAGNLADIAAYYGI